MKYLITGAIIVLIIILMKIRNNKSNSEITLTPSSFSQNRIENLGLKKNPDKDLGILNESKLNFPQKLNNITSKDYRGIEELHWIVDIIPPKGFSFTKEAFLEVFDYEWRTNFESEFYAYFPSTKSWSFAISGDSPEQFDSLELALDLAPRFKDIALNSEMLLSYLNELEKRLNRFDAKFSVEPRETIESAVQRSKSLIKLKDELAVDVVLVLKSDSKYKSKDFWNTFVDLGLEWGDGDVFHWTNHKSGIGDNHFFSVWTTTDPGYFLPEDVSKGKMEPTELVFGYTIPRSADPLGVFDILIESIEHCQSKLGGQILDEYGLPLNREKYRKHIKDVLIQMSENGFTPGQGLILRLI